jgi:hypothetical protein
MANYPEIRVQPSTTVVTQTAAVNTLTTATLAAAGAGLFHYITRIEIECYSTAARAGAAAPLIATSTNLPGTLSWNFQTAGAIGTCEKYMADYASPIKSSTANTATTIVGPATANVIWKIKVYYYTSA